MATKKENTDTKTSSKKADSITKENDFAVIETGGKQYTVEVGTIISIEKLDTEDNKVSFDKVLMKSINGKVSIGTPTLTGESIAADILSTEKDKKIRVFKFKKKTGYKKTRGHRQTLTTVRITSLSKTKK